MQTMLKTVDRRYVLNFFKTSLLHWKRKGGSQPYF